MALVSQMPSVSASRHSVPVDFSSALTMLTLARHSAICKEQAHNTLMCKLTLHETPNIEGTYCTCKSTLHTNVHKHKTQQRLQKMPTSTNIFAQTQAHFTRRSARQAQTHTHKNTCSTHKHLCSTVHKNKHKHCCTKAGTRRAAVGTWQERKERLSAAGATYMQR